MFDFLKRKKKPTDEIKTNQTALDTPAGLKTNHIDNNPAEITQIDAEAADHHIAASLKELSSNEENSLNDQENISATQGNLDSDAMTDTLKASDEVEIPEQNAGFATEAERSTSASAHINNSPSDNALSSDFSTFSDTPNSHPVDISSSEPEKKGFFARLKEGLAKTRASFGSGIANLFLGKKTLDKNLLDEIEMALLTADVGVETTERLIKTLTDKLARNELTNSDAAFDVLRTEMRAILKPCEKALDTATHKPYVILVIGINGSGKTTTIGKMACHYKQLGKNVMLAAGDTFRAAAIDQLQVWGERNQIPVIAQQPGADTAAVIFDAMEAAKARGCDILIADTAGRLHTQTNLMGELQKVKRVLAKLDPTAPHEVLIVLDSTLGQNALNQVIQFNQALGITGIALTKLDGTAKGGIIFAIANQTGIPIRFIGVGEGINDLRPFEADAFVEALFS